MKDDNIDNPGYQEKRYLGMLVMVTMVSLFGTKNNSNVQTLSCLLYSLHYLHLTELNLHNCITHIICYMHMVVTIGSKAIISLVLNASTLDNKTRNIFSDSCLARKDFQYSWTITKRPYLYISILLQPYPIHSMQVTCNGKVYLAWI